jgi:hypothetical protein
MMKIMKMINQILKHKIHIFIFCIVLPPLGEGSAFVAGKSKPPGLPTQGKVLFFFDVARGARDEARSTLLRTAKQ